MEIKSPDVGCDAVWLFAKCKNAVKETEMFSEVKVKLSFRGEQ